MPLACGTAGYQHGTFKVVEARKSREKSKQEPQKLSWYRRTRPRKKANTKCMTNRKELTVNTDQNKVAEEPRAHGSGYGGFNLKPAWPVQD